MCGICLTLEQSDNAHRVFLLATEHYGKRGSWYSLLQELKKGAKQ